MGTESPVPPLARRVPGATNWPTPVARATPPKLPDYLVQRMGVAPEPADAVTEQIPVISASAAGALASPVVGAINARPEPAAWPEPAVQPDRPAEAPEAQGAAIVIRAPAQRALEQPKARPAPVSRRRRAAAASVSALVLIAIGPLAFALSRHTATVTTRDSHRASVKAFAADAATRNRAAAWIAAQASRTTILSCDQAMCQALEAHGIPPDDLLKLNQSDADPLHSDVIVATAAVRSQFGNSLTSVYAPAVIARFGSGNLRIDVRAIAQHGAAAYMSELRDDLAARKVSGAGLLGIQRIAVSAPARRQLSAGRVDSRLLVTIEDMAARHQLRIMAFDDSGPGAGAGSPLRSADLAEADTALGASFPAYVRSMLALLHAQPAPFLPAHAGTVQLAGGQMVFYLEYAAPSPLGLLGPNTP